MEKKERAGAVREAIAALPVELREVVTRCQSGQIIVYAIRDKSLLVVLGDEGLDLARSSESREPWSTVDIDSILSSLAEDAAEFGARVRFVRGCGAQARIKPNALVRCLNNLVENALKQNPQPGLKVTIRSECDAGGGPLPGFRALCQRQQPEVFVLRGHRLVHDERENVFVEDVALAVRQFLESREGGIDFRF